MSDRNPIVVEVTRGGHVESSHRVAFCAVNAAGDRIASAGDIEDPVFLRSAAKPFIAAAAVAAGVRERFALESREIAVIAASHFGRPFQVQAVGSILDKIGMTVADLQCGVHPPYDEAAARALRDANVEPSALHNNCSGKHAGILALCKVLDAPTSTYLRAENPAQRFILDFCARLCDDDAAVWPVAIDGCGIPVYATSLRRAARSFARLATLSGIGEGDARALRIVRDAMVEYPEYVAGTAQLDTELMIAGKPNIVSKAGAEGLHGVAAIAQGVGYVAKVLDGSSRARSPAAIAVLTRLGILDGEQAASLVRFARPAVYNRAGRAVGEVRSV